MSLENYNAIVEDAIRMLGVNPEDTRCAEKGEWLLQRDDLELYMDVWQPSDVNQWQYYQAENPEPVFQVTVPLGTLSRELDPGNFFMDMLVLNAQLYYGTFVFNPQENLVAIQYKRLATGINQREVMEPLNALGYYGLQFREIFRRKFGLKIISE